MSDGITNFGVILFHTSSAVFRVEKILIRGGFPVSLIPTPREFSSDCGIALRFEWDHVTRVRELLNSAKIEFSSIRQFS
jgi:hypothetical protein